MHSYKVDIHNIYRKLILRSQLLFTAGAGFSNNSGKYELSSSLSEILETGMIIFKSNLVKNKRYYEKIIDTTDKSKISSDQDQIKLDIILYPFSFFSFFAYALFKPLRSREMKTI